MINMNFYSPTYHPIHKEYRGANWLDGYFGEHKYGVRFDGEEDVYPVGTVEQVAQDYGMELTQPPKIGDSEQKEGVVTEEFVKKVWKKYAEFTWIASKTRDMQGHSAPDFLGWLENEREKYGN